MHTKGPWTNRKAKGDDYAKILYHITPDFNEHLVIAKVPSSNDTDQANARLIAAAPELLDVVRDCVNFLADLDTKSDRAKALHKRAYTAHSKAKSHADTLKGG